MIQQTTTQTTRAALLSRLVADAADRELCRVCCVCQKFLGGDPEGEKSHGYCEPCQKQLLAEVKRHKQQQQQSAVVLVPSASFNGNHQVRLAEKKCTCLGNQYGKKFCRHLKIARWSKRLSISVAEVLRRIKAGCGSLDCSFCLDARSAYPCPRSAEAQATFRAMVRGEEIGRL